MTTSMRQNHKSISLLDLLNVHCSLSYYFLRLHLNQTPFSLAKSLPSFVHPNFSRDETRNWFSPFVIFKYILLFRLLISQRQYGPELRCFWVPKTRTVFFNFCAPLLKCNNFRFGKSVITRDPFSERTV